MSLAATHGHDVSLKGSFDDRTSSEIEHIVTTADELFRKTLEGLGVLREVRMGREKLFVNTKRMALLTRDSNELEPFTP